MCLFPMLYCFLSSVQMDPGPVQATRLADKDSRQRCRTSAMAKLWIHARNLGVIVCRFSFLGSARQYLAGLLSDKHISFLQTAGGFVVGNYIKRMLVDVRRHSCEGARGWEDSAPPRRVPRYCLFVVAPPRSRDNGPRHAIITHTTDKSRGVTPQISHSPSRHGPRPPL